MDFFRDECLTKLTGVAQFGICDDDNAEPAYVDQNHSESWIANVTNPNLIDIDFIAVDSCVAMVDEEGNHIARCDCMLKYQQRFHFVELKRRRRGNWQSKGFSQLRETICCFLQRYPQIKPRQITAQLCNSQRPSIQEVRPQQLEQFRQQTGVKDVKLDVRVDIS